MRKPVFAYAKTKTQSSFAVIAKLISAFIFAKRIVQSLYFLNPKFQASRHLLSLYSLVCSDQVGNQNVGFLTKRLISDSSWVRSPPQVCVQATTIPGSKHGVFCCHPIREGTQMGPFLGGLSLEMVHSSDNCWEVSVLCIKRVVRFL